MSRGPQSQHSDQIPRRMNSATELELKKKQSAKERGSKGFVAKVKILLSKLIIVSTVIIKSMLLAKHHVTETD